MAGDHPQNDKDEAGNDQGRLDRELVELLQELRVVLPGVQVLFAFLLTVPFTQKFGELDTTDRAVYFAALMLTAASSAFLIAPSVYARVVFRQHSKDRLLAMANPMVIVGSVLLAGAMGCAVYLVADVIYDAGTAALATGVVMGLIVIVWYLVPLVSRRRR